MTVSRLSGEAARTLCLSLLTAAPDFFGVEAVNRAYADQAARGPTFTAGGSPPVGLLSLTQSAPAAWDIHVMAVDAAHRRQGVGAALVAAAMRHARQSGARLLTVKTLGRGRAHAGYAGTRAFYRSQGFLEIEEFPDFWGPDTPMSLMGRIL